MATPFVPVPFAVDWSGACRSWAKKESEPPPPEAIPCVRAVGPWAQTSAYFWRRTTGDMLEGLSTLQEGAARVGESWIERPITPTLLGYEILEERAKFTVYKIHVTTSEGDSWVIFRRYTDFCRLYDKLKELYPGCALALPPKRWFRDNYDEEFLEERLGGLQSFLHSLTLHKETVKSDAVKRFLCLADPPGPFDSLVESRAFCETLEETNHRLQRELLDNQREVDALKKILEEKDNRLSVLAKKARSLTLSSLTLGDQLTETITTDTNTHKDGETDANGSEKTHTTRSGDSADGRGMSITEADQEFSHETAPYIYPLCYWY